MFNKNPGYKGGGPSRKVVEPQLSGEQAQGTDLPVSPFNTDPLAFRQIRELMGVRFSATIPTYIPKDSQNQMVVYINGATKRLYVFAEGAWHYTALT